MDRTGSRVTLNLTGADSMKHVQAGDFISHLRSFQGGLEYSALVGKVSNAYTVLRPRRELVPGYYRWLFKSSLYIQGLQTTTDQLRDGQSIRYGQFALLALPEPPLAIQQAIADFLDRETAQIDNLIAKQEGLIATLDERKQALIARTVLTGSAGSSELVASGVDWMGDVPNSWEVLPIRAFMRPVNERNTDVGNSNYLSLLANVGVIPYAEKGDIGNKAPEDFTRCKIVAKNDFVLNSMNFGIGSFGVSPYSGICSPVYVVLRQAHRQSSTSYLNHVFSLKPFQRHVQSLGNGILEHRAAVGWDDLKNLKFPFPPLEEQIRIGAELNAASKTSDGLRDKAKQAIAFLRERRQALISAAVTGKIDVRG
jgi:type I restriction enzyme S subunit